MERSRTSRLSDRSDSTTVSISLDSPLLLSASTRTTITATATQPRLLPSYFTPISLCSLLLLLAVLLITHLNPSPWLARFPPLFLRSPPPFALLSAAVPPVHGCQDLSVTSLEPREKAAIVLLLREQDLIQLLPTLRNFEHRFNKNFRYPYVFLSSPDSPPFSEKFRKQVAQVLPQEAAAEWGSVGEDHWSIPKWMNKEEVRSGFVDQQAKGVQYAGREAYHHMCRFYSGFWARHPLLAKYDWYWRLEPGGMLLELLHRVDRHLRTGNPLSSEVLLFSHLRPISVPFDARQSLRLRYHYR